jgi:hypothetical protein
MLFTETPISAMVRGAPQMEAATMDKNLVVGQRVTERSGLEDCAEAARG